MIKSIQAAVIHEQEATDILLSCRTFLSWSYITIDVLEKVEGSGIVAVVDEWGLQYTTWIAIAISNL